MTTHQRLCNEKYQEVEWAVERLERLKAAWNGEDERGFFEGEPVTWEDAIEYAKDEVRELQKEWDQMNDLSESEAKADLETPPWK